MTEIFTAKTVEEAKKMASEKFGKDINDIYFKILEEPKKGFLGMGAKDAKVQATYVEKISVEKAEKIKETQAELKAPKQKVTEKIEIPEKAVEKTEDIPEVPVAVSETIAENQNVQEKTDKPVTDDVTKNDEENDYLLENFTLIEDEALMHPKVKLALDYITSILRAMNINPEYSVYQNETGSVINIESKNNGTIIGRRGETLDSIQYLCSIIANKGDKDYFRITIDCLGYRKKRRETLEQLAVKVSKSVLRTGRSQPLEPMNPYERRVIHSAISAIDGVSSHSVGEEPYRKIIISSDNPSPRNNNRRRDRRNAPRNDRRNNRPRNHDNFERKKVDISTSFEKDYKRPKPEDSIEGGLYGKIEL